MNMTLYIPVGIVIVVILLIVVFASRYRTVKADEAMIVTGALTRNGMKIVKAGGTFVWPVVQNYSMLSLQVQTLDIRTPEVYTMHGVPVMVDGVAQVKIKGDLESIATAAEQFLGKPEEELKSIHRGRWTAEEVRECCCCLCCLCWRCLAGARCCENNKSHVRFSLFRVAA